MIHDYDRSLRQKMMNTLLLPFHLFSNQESDGNEGKKSDEIHLR